MTTAFVPFAFADDPVAPHSARFPLGRTAGSIDPSVPSGLGVRPWGLGQMRPVRQQGDPIRETFSYDHGTQVAVDGHGRTLVAAEPTANKVSSNDGDEGLSEDFTYDFFPDAPYQV